MKIVKYAIIMLLLVSGCSSSSYQNVSVQEAHDMIQKGGVYIIDVRTAEEYASGHIPGSELMPLQDLEGMSMELKKKNSYLIVCRSGNRSQQASELLVGKGFKNIYNMTGGMNQWTGDVEM
jgi:rhodanese-related sulfurtransferase